MCFLIDPCLLWLSPRRHPPRKGSAVVCSELECSESRWLIGLVPVLHSNQVVIMGLSPLLSPPHTSPRTLLVHFIFLIFRQFFEMFFLMACVHSV